MKKFIVERNLPGAGNLTKSELQEIAATSCDVVGKLGKGYTWLESFITTDKIYCVHLAASEQDIREHARLGKFPINTISEVSAVIDPLTANSD